MKLIQVNNQEFGKCAQNHKTKYRSSKIQGILRKVGVPTASSVGNKGKENDDEGAFERFKDTVENVVYSKANQTSLTARDARMESRR